MTEQTPYAYGYARMPRIIRKGYKNLTKLQKLLYIYLRDLAGEGGTCYRSLRTLQEETGFSIGYLSENIPVLHNEGLIHAEMKSSPSTHWQVWHISIVDIWEKNAAFLQAEKCSPDEQLIEENVHYVNESVHTANTSSESVHAVNESVHAVILNKNHTKNQLITENNDKEERDVATATARSQSSSSLSQDDETEKREAIKPSQNEAVKVYSWTLGPVLRPMTLSFENIDTEKLPAISQKEAQNGNSANPTPGGPTMGNARNPGSSRTQRQKTNAVTQPPAPEIPEKALHIMDRWDAIHKKPAPRTLKTVQAAQLLMVYDPSEDELRDCEKWLYTTDRPGKPWYRSHGVHLPDIAEKIGSWQSLQEAPSAPSGKSESNGNEHNATPKMYSGEWMMLPAEERRRIAESQVFA